MYNQRFRKYPMDIENHLLFKEIPGVKLPGCVSARVSIYPVIILGHTNKNCPCLRRAVKS